MADAAVANASPLILLSRAGCLDLIRVAAATLVVPGPVLAEIAAKGADDITVQAVKRASWLTIVPASAIANEIAVWELGTGESSVLAWAREHAGSVALLGDLEARRCAESLQIPVLGTVVWCCLPGDEASFLSRAQFWRSSSRSECICPSARLPKSCVV